MRCALFTRPKDILDSCTVFEEFLQPLFFALFLSHGSQRVPLSLCVCLCVCVCVCVCARASTGVGHVFCLTPTNEDSHSATIVVPCFAIVCVWLGGCT